jgi:gas vesicle protein
MDGLSISVEIFIALSSGLISALGVWFKLKSTVQIQKLMIDNIETNLKNAHERITNLKNTVEANREKNETAVTDLKSEISAMEMRIIKAIHEISNK